MFDLVVDLSNIHDPITRNDLKVYGLKKGQGIEYKIRVDQVEEMLKFTPTCLDDNLTTQQRLDNFAKGSKIPTKFTIL